jgi:hypothetical protein
VPCGDAMRRRQANHGAGTGEEACTGVAEAAGAAAGKDCTIAACAAGKATRAEGHSAGGDGTARRGCGRVSVSGAGDSGIGAHPAAEPGGLPRGACEGRASLPAGVDDAFTVSAGQGPSDQRVRRGMTV